MAEEFKSPWQIEHEKMLARQEAEKKAQAKAKRRSFLLGLKITRKSDQSLHEILQAEAENEENVEGTFENGAVADNQAVFSHVNREVIDIAQPEEPQPSIFSALKPLGSAFRKIWPIFVIFLLIFAGSVYELSPLNRIGSFKVTGNAIVKSSDIAASSDLTMQTSIYQIFTHRAAIEAKITNSSPRIKSTTISIAAPNHITVSVQEFPNIGYVEQKGKDYAVLASGAVILETIVPANKLGAHPLLLKDFSNDQVKQFVQAYESLAVSLRSLIQTVTITPSQSTADFISLQMSDGNTVKVPLSQMKQKLPYYPSIAKQVTAPTTVDMEIVAAGIFTSPTPQYNADFADDTPAGLSKSISSSKATASTASSSSGTTGSSSQ